MADSVIIDGSVLEGGGQILRLAISISSVLKRPIKINKIRMNRSKNGLQPQHLTGVQMANELCQGSLTGAVIRSTELEFRPGDVRSGNFEANTCTAGSIALLIQVGLPIALFAPSLTTLKLKGGTNADWAPPVDYTINVFLPLLRKFGGYCDCSIIRRGYYPKGGGEVDLKITPVTTLNAVNLTLFGSLTRIWGRSYVAGVLPINMAHDMADSALSILKRVVTKNVKIDIQRVKESPQDAVGNGSGIVLFAETDTGCILGSSALGSRGVSTKDVGTKAANELVAVIEKEYCVDQHAQDQMIVLMALANGKSIVKCGPLTMHSQTAIYITEMLTDAKFTYHEDEKCGVLECSGIGLKNYEKI